MSGTIPYSNLTALAPVGAAAQLEMASVLFMDIVGYSLEPMERQSGLLQQLQALVRETPEFKKSQSSNQLVSLPTGDGMALVFFDNPTVPVECALRVCRALKEYPEIKLRMGVHTGPVYRIADINANMNVAGGGINMAQRVMDCGDAGHILVSRAVADVLSHLSGWPEHLKDLGEHPVKHGVRMHLYAISMDDVTNREIPQKLRPERTQATRRGGSARSAVLPAGALAVLAAGGILAWQSGWLTTEPVVTDVPERTLAYWIRVQKFRDGKPFQEPFRLARDINFEANYRIQLGFSTPQDGYLYLINEGPESRKGALDYHVLYPSPLMNNGSPRLAANSQIVIPPEGEQFIRFDDQQGTEKLWVIWAKNEPPVVAAAVQAASFTPAGGGSIKDAGRAADLERFLMDASKTSAAVRQDDHAKQSVVTGKGDVLVYLRKLEHH